jgi:DNA polymerase I-like protein with 3'-5' exonuclease and polymerase domains
MIEAYKRGEDLHSQTAALLLKKSLADISKEDRQMAKAVNFGLLYGQSPSGLVKYAYATYEIFLTTARAQSIHSRFFDVYTGLRAWHKANRAAARTATEVRTVSGRRRLLPRGADEDWQRFTGLVNTPIQGGCADGLKAALIVLGRALPPEAHIVSTVHDEIIVETPLDLADQVAAQVETAMRAAMSKLFPNVPIEVEVKQCETWGNK